MMGIVIVTVGWSQPAFCSNLLSSLCYNPCPMWLLSMQIPSTATLGGQRRPLPIFNDENAGWIQPIAPARTFLEHLLEVQTMVIHVLSKHL